MNSLTSSSDSVDLTGNSSIKVVRSSITYEEETSLTVSKTSLLVYSLMTGSGVGAVVALYLKKFELFAVCCGLLAIIGTVAYKVLKQGRPLFNKNVTTTVTNS